MPYFPISLHRHEYHIRDAEPLWVGHGCEMTPQPAWRQSVCTMTLNTQHSGEGPSETLVQVGVVKLAIEKEINWSRFDMA